MLNFSVETWKYWHMSIPALLSLSVSSIANKNLVATASSASGGHGCYYNYHYHHISLLFSFIIVWKNTWSQSMVQQLTSAGNFLILLRKLVPIGDITITMWSWSRVISTKRLNRATALPSVCNARSLCLSICFICSYISANSSMLNMFGI